MSALVQDSHVITSHTIVRTHNCMFFTSNTTLYFLPGEHILGQVVVTDVSNITLAGIMSAEHTILHCPGEGGFAFMNFEKVYMLHLTISNCGADYGTSVSRGLHFQCVIDFVISNIVVTNSTCRDWTVCSECGGICTHSEFTIYI